MMKLLLCEERPTSGKITVGDYELSTLSRFKVPYYRRELGVVFQDFRLFPKMTVFENVAFAMHVVGTPSRVIKRRVPAILNTVNLTDKFSCFPNELSGGEQQRVALARALANNPKIIIADEPTGNIDPRMSIEIMNLLLKINKLGKTVIVVTHEKGLVDYYKQRVVKLNGGKIASEVCSSEKIQFEIRSFAGVSGALAKRSHVVCFDRGSDELPCRHRRLCAHRA